MNIAAPPTSNEGPASRKDFIPAGLLVTTIGLLADFLALRDGQTNIGMKEFIDWLISHDHRDLVQRLRSSPPVWGAFEQMFAEGHGELMTRLEFIDEGLILLCGTQGVIAGVARSVRPDIAIKVHGQ